MIYRTCVVCRKVSNQKDLLRFVCLPSGPSDVVAGSLHVILDLIGSMQGRGAYCHGEISCLLSRQFSKSLRGSFSSVAVRRFGSGVQIVCGSFEDMLTEVERSYTSSDASRRFVCEKVLSKVVNFRELLKVVRSSIKVSQRKKTVRL